MTSVPRITAMMTRVWRAFLASGWRKTLTPLEMASVPVRAEPPAAKDFMTMKRLAPRRRPPPGLPIKT